MGFTMGNSAASHPNADTPEPMLDEAALLKIVPLSRATLARMIRAGTFPKGTYVSPNRRLWLASEIAKWQREVDQFDPERKRGPGRRPRKAR